MEGLLKQRVRSFLRLLAYFCQDRVVVRIKNSFHIAPCINVWGFKYILCVCLLQCRTAISFLSFSLPPLQPLLPCLLYHCWLEMVWFNTKNCILWMQWPDFSFPSLPLNRISDPGQVIWLSVFSSRNAVYIEWCLGFIPALNSMILWGFFGL